jgi:hypothetical protein
MMKENMRELRELVWSVWTQLDNEIQSDALTGAQEVAAIKLRNTLELVNAQIAQLTRLKEEA